MVNIMDKEKKMFLFYDCTSQKRKLIKYELKITAVRKPGGNLFVKQLILFI
jgi:hypothetical protein